VWHGVGTVTALHSRLRDRGLDSQASIFVFIYLFKINGKRTRGPLKL